MKCTGLLIVIISIAFSTVVTLHAQGTFWAETSGPTGESIFCLAVSPQGLLFAGTLGRVYRSADGGQDWDTVYVVQPPTFVQALAFSPTSTVFAGTHYHGGLFRSTNNGTTWTLANSGMTDPSIQAFTISSNGNVLAGTFNGVYSSTDEGSTWVPANAGLTNLAVWSLTTDPESRVYAGTYSGGVFRSTDNGASWILAGFSSLPLVTSVAFGQGVLFAGTNGDKLFRSTNLGNMWSRINNFPDTLVRAIAANSLGTVFVGTESHGVYRSSDGGNTWMPTNEGLTASRVYALAFGSIGHIYAGTDVGVFRSIQSTTAVGGEINRLPVSFVLHQNFPNPFNPTTQIAFDLPQAGVATLKLFNLLGQELGTLLGGSMDAGTHTYTLNADAFQLGSGVYFYRLTAGDFVQTRKMVFMK
jgi:photosystem II stability/assembly factor-like uncharacterized protein